jgi:hypothetical protein
MKKNLLSENIRISLSVILIILLIGFLCPRKLVAGDIEKSPFTVVFKVENPSGVSVDSATIKLGNITNAPGDYTFRNIPHGSYNISITAQGYHPMHSSCFYIYDDMVIPMVIFPILPEYDVTFIVNDQQEQPVINATIYFAGKNNAPGDYFFPGIEQGVYSYRVEAPGFERIIVNGLQVNDNISVEVTMTAIVVTYNISFRINNHLGEELHDAQITLAGNTNAQGDYFFNEMLPGTYPFTVTHQGFYDFSGEIVLLDGDLLEVVQLDEDNVFADTVSQPSLVVYPNPARDLVNITSPELIRQIMVFDLTGRQRLTFDADGNNEIISVTGLQPGIYLLRTETEIGTYTKRLQILR